jgi:NAD(P)-dependent dehydrogenase (short-subunit alcohol dehydrogenase family)
MGRLTGKVAIVTGAASQAEGVGNGAATAILFAREGAKVVLVNRRADRAEELTERIRSEGGEALAFAADVTQPEAAEAMAAVAVANFGPIQFTERPFGRC